MNAFTCTNISIYENPIKTTVVEKLQLVPLKISNVILVKQNNKHLSFYVSIAPEREKFKFHFFVQTGHVTFVGEYLINLIHYELILQAIADFAIFVTVDLNDDLTYEIAYELAHVTEEVAAPFKMKDIDFLVHDFIIREKIANLKRR